MTPKQAVEAFVQSIVEIEVRRLLPMLAHLVPGLAGSLLSSALAMPEVQAKIVELETAGVDKLLDLLFKGVDDLEHAIEMHVHGEALKAIEALEALPMPLIHLTAEEVKAVAVSVENGTWKTTVRHALGLP